MFPRVQGGQRRRAERRPRDPPSSRPGVLRQRILLAVVDASPDQRHGALSRHRAGGAWLGLPRERTPLALEAGDLVMLPHGSGDVMSEDDRVLGADSPRRKPST